MISQELTAVLIYTGLIVAIAFFTTKRQQSQKDFVMGGRSLNFWLVALAAHSSDMSSWLLMGYPAVIFASGLFNSWLAVGLIVFMFLNWHFVAPKLRIMTEKYGSLTISSFFESHVSDTSGLIRMSTAIMQLFYYTIYITAGLVSMGLLMNTLFGLNTQLGMTLSILVVIPYLLIGGYRTLVWTEFFQALFMLAVVIITPLFALKHLGNSFTFHVPRDPNASAIKALFLACSWGLGYFGQPHILTKFMGIKDVANMKKSKYVGMTWQVLTLVAATSIGLLGIAFFPEGLPNDQLVFVDMVRTLFYPLPAAFILCAILAATISTMDSQILVLASSLTEDLYKRLFRKEASSNELLKVSRLSVLAIAMLSYLLALQTSQSIFSLVEYAFFGLGSSFGPLLIVSLYSKRVDRRGAFAGILTGGTVAAVWPMVNAHLPLSVPTLIPAFCLSMAAIFLPRVYNPAPQPQ